MRVQIAEAMLAGMVLGCDPVFPVQNACISNAVSLRLLLFLTDVFEDSKPEKVHIVRLDGIARVP
jgi:hypothetical protein